MSAFVSYLKTLIVITLIVGLFVLGIQLLMFLIPKIIFMVLLFMLVCGIWVLARGAYEQHKHYLKCEKPYLAENLRAARKNIWANTKSSARELRQSFREYFS